MGEGRGGEGREPPPRCPPLVAELAPTNPSARHAPTRPPRFFSLSSVSLVPPWPDAETPRHWGKFPRYLGLSAAAAAASSRSWKATGRRRGRLDPPARWGKCWQRGRAVPSGGRAGVSRAQTRGFPVPCFYCVRGSGNAHVGGRGSAGRGGAGWAAVSREPVNDPSPRGREDSRARMWAGGGPVTFGGAQLFACVGGRSRSIFFFPFFFLLLAAWLGVAGGRASEFGHGGSGGGGGRRRRGI